MAESWNLSPSQWADVLRNPVGAGAVADRLKREAYLPWNEVILRYAQDSKDILDLGSGQGEHAALLAIAGKRVTLLDWAQENLDFSQKLFDALGQKAAAFVRSDMTQRLPFDDAAFDTVFSCGVFEYFTDDQIRAILREAFRVSKKRVVILVPNALSIAYRVGMAHMKMARRWQWGGERPFISFRGFFKSMCRYVQVSEFTVATKHSLNFLTMRGGGTLRRMVIRLFGLTSHSRPARFRQGYLLVCAAEHCGNPMGQGTQRCDNCLRIRTLPAYPNSDDGSGPTGKSGMEKRGIG